MRRRNLLYLVGMLVVALGFMVVPKFGWASAFKDHLGSIRDGGLNQPAKVAVDSTNGDIYVTDAGNKKVKKYDKFGKYISSYNLTVSGTPVGIAVNSANIFVGDDTNDCVWIYNKSTGALADLSGTGTTHKLGGTNTSYNKLKMPNTIAVAPSGHIFAIDGDSDKVYVYNSTGSGNYSFGSSSSSNSTVNSTTIYLYYPIGLAWGGSSKTSGKTTQDFFLGDQGNYRVQKLFYKYTTVGSTSTIKTNPSFTRNIGTGKGDAFGKFLCISDLAWDSILNRLVVVDSLQQVAQVYTDGTNFTTPTQAYNYSGGAVQGKLNTPTGAALSTALGSKLYVVSNQSDSLESFYASDGNAPSVKFNNLSSTDVTPTTSPYNVSYTITDSDSTSVTLNLYYYNTSDPTNKTLLNSQTVTLTAGSPNTYTGSYNWSWTGLAVGDYKLYLAATDAQNNLGEKNSAALKVVNNYDGCTNYTNALYALYGGAASDYDGDGLTNCQELNGTMNTHFGYQPTLIYDKDSDHDGLDDGDECTYDWHSPATPAWYCNPNVADTDNGGIKDGPEVLRGTNPTNPADDPTPRATLVGMYYSNETNLKVFNRYSTAGGVGYRNYTTTQNFATKFEVTNPTDKTVTSTVTFYNWSGVSTYSTGMTFSPHETKTILPSDPGQCPTCSTTGSIEVDGDGGILVGNSYQSVYNSGTLLEEQGVQMRPASTSQTTLYVPTWFRILHLLSSTGYQNEITYIYVKNPNNFDITVHAVIKNASNVTLKEVDIPIAAHGVKKWQPEDYNGGTWTVDRGNVTLTCTNPMLAYLTQDQTNCSTGIYEQLFSYELPSPNDATGVVYSTIWFSYSPYTTWFAYKNISPLAKPLTVKWYKNDGTWLKDSTINYSANGNAGFNAVQKGITPAAFPGVDRGTQTSSLDDDVFIGYDYYSYGTLSSYAFLAPIYSGNTLYVSHFSTTDSTTSGMLSYMSLSNPNNVSVTVTADVYSMSGSLVKETTYSIAAKGTVAKTAKQLGVTEAMATEGNVILKSTLPVKGFIDRTDLSVAGNTYSAWLYEFHPQPPSGIIVTANTGSNTINWTMSPDDPLNSLGSPKGAMDVTYYYIQRATGQPYGGTYTTIATVPAGTATYNDTTTTPGTYYRYKVQATTDGVQVSESPESKAILAQ